MPTSSPADQLDSVLSFRLAQYVMLGWICPRLVLERRLTCEPEAAADRDAVHVVTVSRETGAILGYVGLATNGDPTPRALDDPTRRRLPTEQAHRVDLLRRYASAAVTSADVYEVKRFLRDQAMPRSPLAAMVPWYIVLGFGWALLALGQAHHGVLVVGDAKESVALRHLTLMGLNLEVIDGTTPSLPRTELMWPIYEQESVAKPFVGRIPRSYASAMAIIEEFVSRIPRQESVHELVALLERHNAERSDR